MVKVPSSRKQGKGTKLGPKGEVFKKLKFQGKKLQYKKQGHKSTDCKLSKRNKPKEVNVVDVITKDAFDINLTTVFFEANLVGLKPKE